MLTGCWPIYSARGRMMLRVVNNLQRRVPSQKRLFGSLHDQLFGSGQSVQAALLLHFQVLDR